MDRRTFAGSLASGLVLGPGRARSDSEANCSLTAGSRGWTLTVSFVFVKSAKYADEMTVRQTYRHEESGLAFSLESSGLVTASFRDFEIEGLWNYASDSAASRDWIRNMEHGYRTADHISIGVLQDASDWAWWVKGNPSYNRDLEGPRSESYYNAYVPSAEHQRALFKRLYEEREASFTLQAVGVEKNGARAPLRQTTLEGAGLADLMDNATPKLMEQLQAKIQTEDCSISTCFLTTACCEAFGRADGGIELSTLRAFRDGWLASEPGGAEEIARYYRIAPQICACIAADPLGRLQLTRIYLGTVLPCVALIRLGLRQPARRMYRRMVSRLEATYAPIAD